MSKKLYSIRDIKAGEFSPPFVASSDLEAQRSVVASMSSTSMLTRFSSDYELHCVGSFDTRDGSVFGGLKEDREPADLRIGFVVNVQDLLPEVKNG